MVDEEGFWSNFTLFLKVRWFNFKDLIKTVCCFWLPHPLFGLADCMLLLSYFFKSPYRLVREFTKGQEPYGETPLVVMKRLAKRLPIGSSDVVYELGSGRGRVCLWLAMVIGCKTVGIEQVPTFVQKSARIARLFGVKNVQFIEADMLQQDLQAASVIYLFGTALPDEEITRFVTLCKNVRPGTKIVTVSYALTEYSAEGIVTLIDTLQVPFSWGTTEVYVHRVV